MGSLSEVQISSLFTFDLLDLNPPSYNINLHSPTSNTTDDSSNTTHWFDQMHPSQELQYDEQQEQQQAQFLNAPGYSYPTAVSTTTQSEEQQKQMQHIQQANPALHNYNYGANYSTYSSYTSSPTLSQNPQTLYHMPPNSGLFTLPLTQQPSGGIPLQGFIPYTTAAMPANTEIHLYQSNSTTSHDLFETNTTNLSYPLNSNHNTAYFSSSTSPTPTAASLGKSRGSSSILQDIENAKHTAFVGNRNFSCTYKDCRYKGTFHTEEYLKRHIKEQHLECKRYVCQGDHWGCGKVFKRPYQLVNHWKARRSLLHCNVPMDILKSHCIEKDMNVLSKKLKRRRRWQR